MSKSLDKFKPTWLMIKQHNQTGLKYFCKTVRKDPYTYYGSGLYWTRHLAAHGNDVTTTWAKLFNDKQELVEYALTFSKEHNIVESKEWANLIPENGIQGWVTGRNVTLETRDKIGRAHKGKKISDAQKKFLSDLYKGKERSKETNQKLSDTLKEDYATGKRKPAKGMLGKHLTDEQKEKIRTALTGKSKSESHKENMSKVNKGKTWIVKDGKRVWVNK